MLKSLNRNSYLEFCTAAKFYGASHQQSQKEYVMIEKPKKGDIQKKELKIRFFTASKWSNINIQERKSDAGIFSRFLDQLSYLLT